MNDWMDESGVDESVYLFFHILHYSTLYTVNSFSSTPNTFSPFNTTTTTTFSPNGVCSLKHIFFCRALIYLLLWCWLCM